MSRLSFVLFAGLIFPETLFCSDFAPALDWVKIIGGSGTNAVVAAAADSDGNFYIVGNTSSVDFPITTAPPASRAAGQDIFAVKLDLDGNVIYSTVFGGSGEDTASAMALGPDGSVYITGSTLSADFPATSGAYATGKPGPTGTPASFVSKLNHDGTTGWSTYFADFNTVTNTIAVDFAGNAYIGGATTGNLPTTPGAYQTEYTPVFSCGFFCVPPPTAAFLTKFNSSGNALVFSTYISSDTHQNHVFSAQALVLDPGANCYIGGAGNVVELNAAGSALLASTIQSGINITALALANSDLYAAGDITPAFPNGTPASAFPATPGAFQSGPQPPAPALPSQLPPGGLADAFVIKWDHTLEQIHAATLLGGESGDYVKSLVIDGSGNVIVSGETDSKAFPTHLPFQSSFSVRSGFLTELDPIFSHLLFSTYLGDARPFDSQAVALNGRGSILVAGSTLGASGLFVGGEPGQTFTIGTLIVANKINLTPAPAVQIDSVVNYASRLAGPLAPGEPMLIEGAGFGADAQVLIDGAPLPGTTATPNAITAVIPDDAKTSGVYQVQVSSGGTTSNTVYLPAAPASPGIYSVDGSGYGQGYILNSDGTLNSPSNPASPGSAITIFAAGVGPYTLKDGFAGTSLPPSVYIDGIYANGIAAVEKPVSGLPGNVYELSVYVPDPATLAGQNPNFLSFHYPPQVGIKLVIGDVNPLNPDNSDFISQNGIVLNVR